MDYHNRMMTEGMNYGDPNTASYTGPPLLKYGQVVGGGPGMMGGIMGPGMAPGATPPTQAQIDNMMQNNPAGYVDFDDLVKQYSSTNPYMSAREEIKSMVDGRDAGYMSAQDYHDQNVLGLSGQEIAEKYNIPYKQGGRVGFANGTDYYKGVLRRKGYKDSFFKGMSGKDIRNLYDSVMGTFSLRRAQGGRINKLGGGVMGLPVRQNSAGVKELDLRDSGGFVPPIGVKEKADDIPAMLSNNEFVFTADAVRAAGGGSVEKGAQRMYDTMKKLESRIA